MTQQSQPTPNTHLGGIHWWADAFFGTMLYVCQDLLGMNDTPPVPCRSFLDTDKYSVLGLWDFFGEIELSNGMLGLDLFPDDSYQTLVLATIETTIPFGDEVDDQTFLNLIEDFKIHVRSLPLADPEKREGALWTDEDIERGYCEEANKLFAEGMEAFGEALASTRRQIAEEVSTFDEVSKQTNKQQEE